MTVPAADKSDPSVSKLDQVLDALSSTRHFIHVDRKRIRAAVDQNDGQRELVTQMQVVVINLRTGDDNAAGTSFVK
jgi:hypothetical protein